MSACLVVDGRELPERAVASLAVEEDLDVVEDLRAEVRAVRPMSCSSRLRSTMRQSLTTTSE